MMRGAQLAIVRKLESQYIIAIHTQLLGWVAKRLGAYESNKHQKKKEAAVLFFKVLQPLLAPLESRDALAMYFLRRLRDFSLIGLSLSSKAHLDQVLAQAKVQVSATSPIWEPQRSYERRLTNIMSKIKGMPPKSLTRYTLTPLPGTASKPRGRPAAKPAGTSDEESGEQSAADEPARPQEPASQHPRPRAAYRTRSRSKSAEADTMSAAGEEDGKLEADDGDALLPRKIRRSSRASSTRSSQPPPIVTSASRSRRSKSKSARSSSVMSSLSSRSARSTLSPDRGETAPKVSRKRTRISRHDDEDQKGRDGDEDTDAEVGEGGGREAGVTRGEGDDDDDDENVVPNEDRRRRASSSRSPGRPPSRASSAGAPEEDFRVRRKRARH